MNICASLQFNKNSSTTGYSRSLLLAMSLVDCLNSNHNLVGMIIFIDTRKTSSDVDNWLAYIVSAWLPKLFRDAQFAKPAVFSVNDSDPESGTMTLDGREIPIRFIYRDDPYNDDPTTESEKKEAMALYIQKTKADLILSTSNFPFSLWNDLNEIFIKLGIKLKILLVEGVNASVYKALPVSSISDMQSIWKKLENDNETYAAYSVGINDIFIKVLKIIDISALIEDLKTNNSFFELINTNPLEITSSGNNIVSSAQTIMPELKIDKIKYLRTFATSLKNKGDKIVVKLNSIKVDRQITKDSLNELIAKKFNKATFSLPKCEAVDRSVNVKETDKLYFILTDTTCEEIKPIQTDNKTIYEYNLRLVFEIDSIMKYMSKLVLLIVNNLSAYLP